MSRWIDADAVKEKINTAFWAEIGKIIDNAPSIDLADYVPKEFHDKTCEAMAKAHQEEIANMVSVVRCKECKYWRTSYCSNMRGLMDADADDFCSYGERKESE